MHRWTGLGWARAMWVVSALTAITAAPAVPDPPSSRRCERVASALLTSNDLYVVAHPDDDLLFMNPDVQTDITAGRAVRTVYVTSGDGGGPASWWQSRETGVAHGLRPHGQRRQHLDVRHPRLRRQERQRLHPDRPPQHQPGLPAAARRPGGTAVGARDRSAPVGQPRHLADHDRQRHQLHLAGAGEQPGGDHDRDRARPDQHHRQHPGLRARSPRSRDHRLLRAGGRPPLRRRIRLPHLPGQHRLPALVRRLQPRADQPDPGRARRQGDAGPGQHRALPGRQRIRPLVLAAVRHRQGSGSLQRRPGRHPDRAGRQLSDRRRHRRGLAGRLQRRHHPALVAGPEPAGPDGHRAPA